MKYRVKNWRTFQHYKDRNPVWIKLHFSILTSSDWVALADSSRLLAIVCMLVASRNNGEIDGSPAGLAYLQRIAYLNKKPDLTPLIECGFLESASKVEQTVQNAIPETYKEETEKKQLNGSRSAHLSIVDDSPVIQTLPLVDGSEFEVRGSLVAELEPLYPKVDIPATLNEMKGWLIGHAERRKTRKGVKAFITRWLHSEQQKAA